MSATMDVDLFSQYFGGAPVLYLEGRQHPIQVLYTKQPQQDYLHAALVSIFQIHQVQRAARTRADGAQLAVGGMLPVRGNAAASGALGAVPLPSVTVSCCCFLAASHIHSTGETTGL